MKKAVSDPGQPRAAMGLAAMLPFHLKGPFPFSVFAVVLIINKKKPPWYLSLSRSSSSTLRTHSA